MACKMLNDVSFKLHTDFNTDLQLIQVILYFIYFVIGFNALWMKKT